MGSSFVVLLMLSQAGWSAPPLVSAPEGPPPTPQPEVTAPPPPTRPEVAAPAVKEPERDFPLWQVSVLATASVPTSLEGSDFLLGLRGEVDVWRIGALFTYDRVVATPFTISQAAHWSGLAGYALLVNRYARIRALGGVSALTTGTSSQVGPSLGATARVGIAFIAVEAGVVFTPFGGLRQLDARAELVLKGGVFELHGGYRALFSDTSATGTLSTLFASTPVAGPSVGVGFSF